MEKKKGALSGFLKGFLITLLVLAPAYYYVYTFTQDTVRQAEEIAAPPAESVAVETTPKNYNLLLMISDSDTERLVAATVMRFDTKHSRILACSIPLTAVFIEEGEPRTISEIFTGGGAKKLGGSVEENLEIPISGYILADSDLFAEIIDTLGAFSFTLDRKVEMKNSEGLVVYSKEQGTSELSGNDVVKLITYGPHEKEEATELRERLMESAVREYGYGAFSDKLPELYSSSVNRLDTDISLSGMYALAKAAGYVCNASGVEFSPIRLSGSYVGYRFELSADSVNRLTSHFGTIAE